MYTGRTVAAPAAALVPAALETAGSTGPRRNGKGVRLLGLAMEA